MRLRLPTFKKNLFTLWLGTIFWILATLCFAMGSYCMPPFLLNEALDVDPPGLLTIGTWGFHMMLWLAGSGALAAVATLIIIVPRDSGDY